MTTNEPTACLHQSLAYSDTRTWCEDCGADLDPNDTTRTLEEAHMERHVPGVAEYRARLEAEGRVYATDRAETDACEAGTPGCAIDHTADRGNCEGW